MGIPPFQLFILRASVSRTKNSHIYYISQKKKIVQHNFVIFAKYLPIIYHSIVVNDEEILRFLHKKPCGKRLPQGLQGKSPYFLTTDPVRFRSFRISRCWGQAVSQAPQSRQLLGSGVSTGSQGRSSLRLFHAEKSSGIRICCGQTSMQ